MANVVKERESEIVSDTITFSRADLDNYKAAKNRQARLKEQLEQAGKDVIALRAKLDDAILDLIEPKEDMQEKEATASGIRRPRITADETNKLKAAIADVLASEAPSKDKGIKASVLKDKVHAKEPAIKKSFIDKVRNELKGAGIIGSDGKKAKAVWFFKATKKK